MSSGRFVPIGEPVFVGGTVVQKEQRNTDGALRWRVHVGKTFVVLGHEQMDDLCDALDEALADHEDSLEA